MDLLGKALSHYGLDRPIAEGSIGTVYQAYDLSMQRDVAIKVIHTRYARQPGDRTSTDI
jgi:serine/threonine protein kinase